MTRRKRKKRKKTIGTKAISILWLSFLTAVLAVGVAGGPKPAQEAVVAGTVFRDPGFSVAGAEVVVEAKTLPPGVKKLKPIRQKSDARGEFAVHVPAGTAKYVVTAKAPGFEPASKEVDVSADERVDVFLTLKAQAAKE
jgi:hypothetical protein